MALDRIIINEKAKKMKKLTVSQMETIIGGGAMDCQRSIIMSGMLGGPFGGTMALLSMGWAAVGGAI